MTLFILLSLCNKFRMVYGRMTMKCRFRWEANYSYQDVLSDTVSRYVDKVWRTLRIYVRVYCMTDGCSVFCLKLIFYLSKVREKTYTIIYRTSSNLYWCNTPPSITESFQESIKNPIVLSKQKPPYYGNNFYIHLFLILRGILFFKVLFCPSQIQEHSSRWLGDILSRFI